MKIIGAKFYKFLYITILFCLFIILNLSKPMQMDELSTLNHCAGKTWPELVMSRKLAFLGCP